MIRAWRLTMRLFADTAFTGKGAFDYGGRWNHPGAAVVYLSSTLPLAALETLIRLNRKTVRTEFVSFEIGMPDSVKIVKLDPRTLPAGWKRERHLAYTRNVGTQWALKNESAVLQVPSALIPSECNYVLNPKHPHFKKIIIHKPQPFSFDPRLRK